METGASEREFAQKPDERRRYIVNVIMSISMNLSSHRIDWILRAGAHIIMREREPVPSVARSLTQIRNVSKLWTIDDTPLIVSQPIVSYQKIARPRQYSRIFVLLTQIPLYREPIMT